MICNQKFTRNVWNQSPKIKFKTPSRIPNPKFLDRASIPWLLSWWAFRILYKLLPSIYNHAIIMLVKISYPVILFRHQTSAISSIKSTWKSCTYLNRRHNIPESGVLQLTCHPLRPKYWKKIKEGQVRRGGQCSIFLKSWKLSALRVEFIKEGASYLE